jgi:tetratricopeptide (TPR) repeat protein
MKPRVLCAECGAEINLGDKNCAGCGTTIEWPANFELEESGASPAGPRTCNRCGTENAADASFCSSCGVKLQGAGKQQAKSSRQSAKQEKGRDSRKKEPESTPLFSWKVIFGFLGVVAILVIVFEVFSSREQAPVQQQPAASQMPTANIQLAGQISEMEKQVAANPADMQSVLKLANICQDGRFFDKAITYYKRFLEKNPKDANARVDLGICHFEKGELDEAQKQMQLALKYEPKHVQGHFNLGIVNLRAGHIQEANEWFKKTIALAPPNSDIGQQAKQFLEQHSNPLIQNK